MIKENSSTFIKILHDCKLLVYSPPLKKYSPLKKINSKPSAAINF